MITFYILFLMSIVVICTENVMNSGIEAKVVGGVPVDISAFPYAVMFFNVNNMCGGNILNTKIILTVAHCLDLNKNVSKMMIQAGSRYIFDKNAKSYDVHDYLIHEDYNKTVIFSCDIALLLLQHTIVYGNKIQKAFLVNDDSWTNSEENIFYTAGWGWTKYGGTVSKLGLMYTNLRYIPLDKCMKLHKSRLTPDMFCLYGDGERDSCKGDSGGGILWNGVVVGLVSHGEGCALKNKPSVYTNVYYLRQWIDNGVKRLEEIYCQDLELNKISR